MIWRDRVWRMTYTRIDDTIVWARDVERPVLCTSVWTVSRCRSRNRILFRFEILARKSMNGSQKLLSSVDYHLADTNDFLQRLTTSSAVLFRPPCHFCARKKCPYALHQHSQAAFAHTSKFHQACTGDGRVCDAVHDRGGITGKVSGV